MVVFKADYEKSNLKI